MILHLKNPDPLHKLVQFLLVLCRQSDRSHARLAVLHVHPRIYHQTPKIQLLLKLPLKLLPSQPQHQRSGTDTAEINHRPAVLFLCLSSTLIYFGHHDGGSHSP